LPNKGPLWPTTAWNPRPPANVFLSTFNVTQTGYACQYANAFRDSNRFYPVQNVTAGIACHILLKRGQLDSKFLQRSATVFANPSTAGKLMTPDHEG